MLSAQQIIQQFNLQSHPEGGYYKETYRGTISLPSQVLSPNFNGDRIISTAIYFLLEANHFSAFHKIKSDECWHFYMGGVLEIYVLHQNGALEIVRLGNDIQNGQVVQYVVPANCWFASKPADGVLYSFVGCTVAPGFDFLDFELAKTVQLVAEYPQYKQVVEKLCIL